MINFVTVHYRSDTWIDLQLRYIERYTRAPYRVWACLDGIDRSHFGKFHHAESLGDRVGAKFDHLADLVCADAEPDDWLVFAHGDTLPIADRVPVIEKKLERHPLVGVRRDENLGEPIRTCASP